MGLFDEQGQRIRGKENRAAAEDALARAKVADASQAGGSAGGEGWLVAKICSEYIQYCERGLAAGSLSQGHRNAAVWFLNDLCGYCSGGGSSAVIVPLAGRSHNRAAAGRRLVYNARPALTPLPLGEVGLQLRVVAEKFAERLTGIDRAGKKYASSSLFRVAEQRIEKGF